MQSIMTAPPATAGDAELAGLLAAAIADGGDTFAELMALSRLQPALAAGWLLDQRDAVRDRLKPDPR